MSVDFKLGNPAMTSLLFKNTTNSFTKFALYTFDASSSLITLDLSYITLTNCSYFDLTNSSALTKLILKVGSTFNSIVNFTNCDNLSSYLNTTNFGIAAALIYTNTNSSMTAAEVNRELVILDSSGYSNGSCVLTGNAAPDSISGGYNGTVAKANLISKGWTVTTA